MAAVIRAFIAIDLSAEIRNELDRVISELRHRLEGAQVRWVSTDSIHLTLKFLGDVSVSNIEVLKNMLLVQVAQHKSFEISVGELGAFPSAHRPRVVWVGVQAPAELSQIQHGIETETARLGYKAEDRGFSPHLTLGRVSRNASSTDARRIGEVLDAYKVGFLGVTRVKGVHLYKSDLQPGGAVYTRLFTAPLKE